MKLTQTKITSFELYLSESESESAAAVAASAGVSVPDLLVSMLDSSLTCAHDALLELHDLKDPLELDADDNEIPSIDDINPM